MKKFFFAAVLAAAVACLTAFADGDNVGETIGFVADAHGDVLHVVGEPLNERGLWSALVRLNDAPVYDLRTGTRLRTGAIEPGTDVRVAYDLRGDEPLCAVVVWLNWSDDDAAAFTVVVGDNIFSNDEGTVFLCANEKYRVSVSSGTTIIDPERGHLFPSDIVPGMEFFVWTDMVTASSPALVYPDKVVVVR